MADEVEEIAVEVILEPTCWIHLPNIKSSASTLLALTETRVAKVLECARGWVNTTKEPQSSVAAKVLSEADLLTTNPATAAEVPLVRYAHDSCYGNFANTYKVEKAGKAKKRKAVSIVKRCTGWA